MMAALTFLKSVPSWAWGLGAALLLALGVYVYGQTQYNAGKQAVIERLEKAEEEAKLAAEKAMREADKQAQERALAFAAQQAALRSAINESETTGGNALDSVFGSLSENN